MVGGGACGPRRTPTPTPSLARTPTTPRSPTPGQVREDHFVRGTDEDGALLVHCQHVMRQLKTLHTQTHHLLASVHLGESRWAADALLFDERLALREMVRPPPAARPPTPPHTPRTPHAPHAHRLTRSGPTVRAARCARMRTC